MDIVPSPFAQKPMWKTAADALVSVFVLGAVFFPNYGRGTYYLLVLLALLAAGVMTALPHPPLPQKAPRAARSWFLGVNWLAAVGWFYLVTAPSLSQLRQRIPAQDQTWMGMASLFVIACAMTMWITIHCSQDEYPEGINTRI